MRSGILSLALSRLVLPCLALIGLASSVLPNKLAAQAPTVTPAEQARLLQEAEQTLRQWQAFYRQGNYRDAIPLADKTLQLIRQAVGDEHLKTAEARDSLGVLLKMQGEFPAARKHLEVGLAIRRKLLREEHIDVATSCHNLGMLLFDLADYPAARKHFEQAIAIELKLLGENHRYTANSYEFLGNVLRELGEYPAARTHLEKALTIRRKVVGEQSPDTAWSYNNLGILHFALGDYPSARAFHEAALAIRLKVLGENRMETGASYNNLGNALQELGDNPAALRNFELSLAIQRQVLGDAHPMTAQTYGSLGNVLYDLGETAKSRDAYEHALAIQRKVLGDQHPDTGRTYINLGNILFQQEDYAAARTHFEQGLAIYRKSLGEEHPETASSRTNLGTALSRLGDHGAARQQFESSLASQRKTLGEEHPRLAGLYSRLAMLESSLGDFTAAAEWIDRERRGMRGLIARVLPMLSEREQLQYLEVDFRRNTSGALSLVMKRRDDRALVGKGAEWLLNSKGVGQAALAERALLARESRNSERASVAQELLQVREALANLSFAIPKPEEIAQRRQRLDALAQRDAELSRQLVQAGGNARAQETWIDLASVRRALPKGAQFIDFARFDYWSFGEKKLEVTGELYLAFVVPADGEGEVRLVDLGDAETIDKLIAEWRQAIAKSAAGDGAEVQAQLAQQVADRLWKPLAPQVKAGQSLFLSPDGALWLAPWAALPVGDERLLLEDHPLALLVSGRDLIVSAKTKSPTVPVIFADPDYSLPPQTVEEASKAVLRGAYREAAVVAGGKSQLGRVDRLPGTAAEAQLVQPSLAKLSGAEPTVYTERYALESVVKSLNRPQVALFSTHGFFLPDQQASRTEITSPAIGRDQSRGALVTQDGQPFQNPLVRCGLLFAGCNPRNEGQPGRGDDGVLTGMEVMGIDFRGTELVVLSACESGVGTVNLGDGVAGLRQAFQLAGARSVLATLWQIPDRDSALIMNDFFKNLAHGQSQAQALRNAQLARIGARRERYGDAPPFYWAAWTITGRP